MDIEAQFYSLSAKLNALEEPTTADELASYMAVLSETLEVCEKLLIYLATSPSRSDDMLDILFEYKQLISLDARLSKMNLPKALPSKELEPLPKKWWWKR